MMSKSLDINLLWGMAVFFQKSYIRQPIDIINVKHLFFNFKIDLRPEKYGLHDVDIVKLCK